MYVNRTALTYLFTNLSLFVYIIVSISPRRVFGSVVGNEHHILGSLKAHRCTRRLEIKNTI